MSVSTQNIKYFNSIFLKNIFYILYFILNNNQSTHVNNIQNTYYVFLFTNSFLE